MSVKGQEFPAYDPRGIQGIGLNYATSNRGACHLRGYTIASEVLGIPVKTEHERRRRQGRNWSRPSRTPPRWSIRPGCAYSRPSPGAWTISRRRSTPPAKATGAWRIASKPASESGTWNACSTKPPASPPTTTSCRKRLLEGSDQGRPDGRARSTASDEMLPQVLRSQGLDRRTARFPKETRERAYRFNPDTPADSPAGVFQLKSTEHHATY